MPTGYQKRGKCQGCGKYGKHGLHEVMTWKRNAWLWRRLLWCPDCWLLFQELVIFPPQD